MTEKLQESLANFMKKQASSKPAKTKEAKKSAAAAKNAEAKSGEEAKEGENKQADEQEMTEEEQLEEAKKESRSKAANMDQTEMIKKMIMENVVKYVLLISLLVMFTIGLIKGGPAFFEMLHGLFFKVLLGSGS